MEHGFFLFVWENNVIDRQTDIPYRRYIHSLIHI